MGIEIEKKYLLDALPFDMSGFKRKSIVQGYVSTDPTIRVRRVNGGYILTVKGSGAMAREEFELMLTQSQFDELEQRVKGAWISKTRYLVPIPGGLTAELDVYDNELDGLLTVEVEFGSMQEADNFTPPDWFGTDVTFDKRYKNSSLSRNGLP